MSGYKKNMFFCVRIFSRSAYATCSRRDFTYIFRSRFFVYLYGVEREKRQFFVCNNFYEIGYLNVFAGMMKII